MEPTPKPLGSRIRPRNQEHFCGTNNVVNFPHLISEQFSRPAKAFYPNEDFVSSTFGVDSEVLRLVWFAYGGAILKAGYEAVHLLWLLSHLKLNIPWITIARFWGVGKEQFQRKTEGLVLLLSEVMDEV